MGNFHLCNPSHSLIKIKLPILRLPADHPTPPKHFKSSLRIAQQTDSPVSADISLIVGAAQKENCYGSRCLALTITLSARASIFINMAITQAEISLWFLWVT